MQVLQVLQVLRVLRGLGSRSKSFIVFEHAFLAIAQWQSGGL